ncbi:hypothetical protein [Xenorhabdus ishibashii]|uniref:Inverse autotransporter beta-barrel domain-containing protein n=1 Tax=Xenorhabdus ishibashii TaxID=1034471 RepID=A0A2D0KIH9_9GAMM|nr:hypothetical protein [Xenorhabdus ishibashii]PHM63239.1 hypothetical protein Xish_02473 [Xenorhabdus ishibashii]
MTANTHMDISLKPADDLFISQQREFTVTLISDTGIDTDKSITVKKVSKNIKFDQDVSNPIKLVYGDKSLTATADLSFTVLETVGNNPVHDGDNITFEIDTDATSSGIIFNNVNFTGKAKAMNNKMEISINQKADLVIGQSVSFTVTLSSDQLILPDKHVTIKNANIKFDQDINNPINLSYIDGHKKAFAQLSFTVEDPSGTPIQDGSQIIFEIHTDAATSEGDFNFIGFIGKANEIDVGSLALFVEKPYLQTPLISNSKPLENNFTPVYTTLKSKSGKKLVGTPIFITSVAAHKMNEFNFKDAGNIDIIPEKIGPNDGIMLTSDGDGLVKFYLHPKLALVGTVELKAIILDNIESLAKKIIYIVNYIEPGYMNSIGTPDIFGYDPSGIYANSGLPYFMTSVSSYDTVSPGDTILFFVKDLQANNLKFTGHKLLISNPKKQLDQYNIKIPYSIFEQQSKPYEFSYSVVKPTGDTLYSETLPVTYLGGVFYEPEPEVKRSYDMCIVHPSIGVDPNIAIPPVNSIGYDNIMKYPGYTYNGLFIEIIRSQGNDSKAKLNPVPLDITDITLNMYINSDNKNFTKSYTKQIDLKEIGGPGNKNSIYFHIPYDDIIGINWRGNISFDYQFFKDEIIQYSAVWDGYIGTTPPPGSN